MRPAFSDLRRPHLNPTLDPHPDPNPDPGGAPDGWFLDRVVVRGPGGEEWTFPCGAWMGSSADTDNVGALGLGFKVGSGLGLELQSQSGVRIRIQSNHCLMLEPGIIEPAHSSAHIDNVGACLTLTLI